MTNQLLLTSVGLDELQSFIADSISREFERFRPKEPEPETDLIKIDEVAKLLNVSKVTIFAWKKAGLIPFYRISNKVYFKRAEVIEALKKIERKRF